MADSNAGAGLASPSLELQRLDGPSPSPPAVAARKQPVEPITVVVAPAKVIVVGGGGRGDDGASNGIPNGVNSYSSRRRPQANGTPAGSNPSSRRGSQPLQPQQQNGHHAHHHSNHSSQLSVSNSAASAAAAALPAGVTPSAARASGSSRPSSARNMQESLLLALAGERSTGGVQPGFEGLQPGSGPSRRKTFDPTRAAMAAGITMPQTTTTNASGAPTVPAPMQRTTSLQRDSGALHSPAARRATQPLSMFPQFPDNAVAAPAQQQQQSGDGSGIPSAKTTGNNKKKPAMMTTSFPLQRARTLHKLPSSVTTAASAAVAAAAAAPGLSLHTSDAAAASPSAPADAPESSPPTPVAATFADNAQGAGVNNMKNINIIDNNTNKQRLQQHRGSLSKSGRLSVRSSQRSQRRRSGSAGRSDGEEDDAPKSGDDSGDADGSSGDNDDDDAHGVLGHEVAAPVLGSDDDEHHGDDDNGAHLIEGLAEFDAAGTGAPDDGITDVLTEEEAAAAAAAAAPVSRWQHFGEQVVESLDETWGMAIMTIATLYCLFGDNIRLTSFPPSADEVFVVLSTICFVMFVLEFAAFCLWKPEYRWSFFFFLDILALVSLLPEMPFIWDPLIDGLGARSALDEGAATNLAAIRASRASRSGSRAGRLMRMTRLVRFLRIVKLYEYCGDTTEEQKKAAEKEARRKRRIAQGLPPDVSSTNRGSSAGTTTTTLNTHTHGQPSQLHILSRIDEENGGHAQADKGGDKDFPPLGPMNALDEEEELLLKEEEEAKKAQEDWLEEQSVNSEIGKGLSDVITKTVIMVVLLLLFVLPLMETNVEDMSPAMLVNAIELKWGQASTSADLPVAEQTWESSLDQATSLNLMHNLMDEFAEQVGDKLVALQVVHPTADMPAPFSLDYLAGMDEDDVWPEEVLLSGSSVNWDLLGRLRPKEVTRIRTEHVQLWLSRRSSAYDTALLGMMSTLVVVVLIAGASALFSKDAADLVLTPIEKMVLFVTALSANPLAKIKMQEGAGDANGNQRDAKGNLLKSNKQTTRPLETQLLETTFLKLAGLLQIGFGAAGAEIIAHNMRGDRLDPLVKGRKCFAIFGFCLARGTQVLAADGKTTLPVEDVRAGTQLLGEFGPVNVLWAPVEGEELPVSEVMYEITHADGTRYTMTPDHKVTLFVKQGPKLETIMESDADMDAEGERQLTSSKTKYFHALMPERPDAGHHVGRRALRLPATDPSSDETMWAQLEDELSSGDATSDASQMAWFGDVIDVNVEHLFKHFDKFKQHCDGYRNVLADHGHAHAQMLRLDSGVRVSDEFMEAMRGSMVRSAVISEPRVPEGWRSLQPGDAANVLFVLPNDLAAAHQQSLRNLERWMDQLRIDRAADAGVVLMTAAADAQSDDLRLMLSLGPQQLVVFGHSSFHCRQWRSVVQQLRSVSDFTEGRSETGVRFMQFRYAAVAAEPHAITVWFTAHPQMNSARGAVKAALSEAFGVTSGNNNEKVELRSRIGLESIRRIAQPTEFARISVDGNHRFTLADRTITHNCDIRGFAGVTEALGPRVMAFTNTVAEILHELVHKHHGGSNKNLGNAFLLVWKPSAQAIRRATAMIANANAHAQANAAAAGAQQAALLSPTAVAGVASASPPTPQLLSPPGHTGVLFGATHAAQPGGSFSVQPHGATTPGMVSPSLAEGAGAGGLRLSIATSMTGGGGVPATGDNLLLSPGAARAPLLEGALSPLMRGRFAKTNQDDPAFAVLSPPSTNSSPAPSPSPTSAPPTFSAPSPLLLPRSAGDGQMINGSPTSNADEKLPAAGPSDPVFAAATFAASEAAAARNSASTTVLPSATASGTQQHTLSRAGSSATAAGSTPVPGTWSAQQSPQHALSRPSMLRVGSTPRLMAAVADVGGAASYMPLQLGSPVSISSPVPLHVNPIGIATRKSISGPSFSPEPHASTPVNGSPALADDLTAALAGGSVVGPPLAGATRGSFSGGVGGVSLLHPGLSSSPWTGVRRVSQFKSKRPSASAQWAEAASVDEHGNGAEVMQNAAAIALASANVNANASALPQSPLASPSGGSTTSAAALAAANARVAFPLSPGGTVVLNSGGGSSSRLLVGGSPFGGGGLRDPSGTPFSLEMQSRATTAAQTARRGSASSAASEAQRDEAADVNNTVHPLGSVGGTGGGLTTATARTSGLDSSQRSSSGTGGPDRERSVSPSSRPSHSTRTALTLSPGMQGVTGGGVGLRVGGLCADLSAMPASSAMAVAAKIAEAPHGPRWETLKQLADDALVAFLQSLVAINISRELDRWRSDPALVALAQAKNPAATRYTIDMGFGLHAGWAIEGSIGSALKIDASYLSPNVNIAARLDGATKQYGVPLLFSGSFRSLLQPDIRARCRHLDRITVKGSSAPIDIYTFDIGKAAMNGKLRPGKRGGAAGAIADGGAGGSAPARRGSQQLASMPEGADESASETEEQKQAADTSALAGMPLGGEESARSATENSLQRTNTRRKPGLRLMDVARAEDSGHGESAEGEHGRRNSAHQGSVAANGGAGLAPSTSAPSVAPLFPTGAGKVMAVAMAAQRFVKGFSRFKSAAATGSSVAPAPSTSSSPPSGAAGADGTGSIRVAVQPRSTTQVAQLPEAGSMLEFGGASAAVTAAGTRESTVVTGFTESSMAASASSAPATAAFSSKHATVAQAPPPSTSTPVVKLHMDATGDDAAAVAAAAAAKPAAPTSILRAVSSSTAGQSPLVGPSSQQPPQLMSQLSLSPAAPAAPPAPLLSAAAMRLNALCGSLQVAVSPTFIAHHNAAVRLYLAGRWSRAREVLETHVLPSHPDDGPALKLMQRMKERKFKAPKNWPGYTKLTDK